jgi:hypothetical protein
VRENLRTVTSRKPNEKTADKAAAAA